MPGFEDNRSLGQQIDGRICPPDQVIDWQSPVVSTAELAVINHTHGIIGNYVKGPEMVRVAVGLRTLREVEGLKQASYQAYEDVPSAFIAAVDRREEALSQELRPRVSNLRFAGKADEIVPTILDQYSADFSYPEGVIEDLSALATDRAVNARAVREGLFANLDLELFLTLDGLITGMRFDRKSPLARLEIMNREKGIIGRLTGLHRDVNGRTFIEMGRDRDNSRERISYDSVTSVGVSSMTEAVPPVTASAV